MSTELPMWPAVASAAGAGVEVLSPAAALLSSGVVAALKPVNQEVHCRPDAAAGESLAHELRAAWQPAAAWGRMAFVTRLDRPCSGLVVIATNPRGVTMLQWSTQRYGIDRCYALVL